MRRLRLAALLFGAMLPLAAVPPLAAQSAARNARDYLGFLPAADLEQLFAKGELTNLAGSVEELPLWKSSPFREIVRSAVNGVQPTITAEGIFLIDVPSAPAEALDLRIFQSFTAFSSLKGLQVFSVSKNAMETFLFDSSLVESVERPTRLPDPVVSSVPARSDYTVYEKEEQTGDSFVRFHLDFDSAQDTFAVTVTNLTKMNYIFFTLVQPQDLRTVFFVVPCSDRLVLYGLTAVKTGHFLGLERMKEKSFYHRLRALVSWFASNLHR